MEKVINLEKIKWNQLKKFDIVYVEAYDSKILGFIDFIEEDFMVIKDGFGRGTNFALWKKDEHKICILKTKTSGAKG